MLQPTGPQSIILITPVRAVHNVLESSFSLGMAQQRDQQAGTWGGVVIANRSADVTAIVAGEAVVGSQFTLQAGLLV